MLHHFTSIKTLGLILKYRTIKFNRTDFVNDPLDGYSSTFAESRKLSFIACFTRRKDDSLPMWSMYTDDFNGVRISVPDDIFGAVEQHRFGLKIRDIKENPLNQEAPYLAGPENVVYKKSKAEIDHEIITMHENRFVKSTKKKVKQFNPRLIGKFKLKDWEFEKECRFILPAIDYSFSAIDDCFDDEIGKIKEMIKDLPPEVYISFKEEILQDTEILLGPKTDSADQLIVNALVETYTSGVKSIRKSEKVIN